MDPDQLDAIVGALAARLRAQGEGGESWIELLLWAVLTAAGAVLAVYRLRSPGQHDLRHRIEALEDRVIALEKGR